MVTVDDVRVMVDAAQTDPVMMKSLKNLNISDYWVNKYRDFEVMLNAEYPALVGMWGIDLHCLRLYSKSAEDMEFYPGKAEVLRMMAETHKQSILDDMEEISNILHHEYEDFFGLGW